MSKDFIQMGFTIKKDLHRIKKMAIQWVYDGFPMGMGLKRLHQRYVILNTNPRDSAFISWIAIEQYTYLNCSFLHTMLHHSSKSAFKPAREATVSRPPDAAPSEESDQPLVRELGSME